MVKCRCGKTWGDPNDALGFAMCDACKEKSYLRMLREYPKQVKKWRQKEEKANGR